MEYIDEELAAILGQDFALSPGSDHSSSSSILIHQNPAQNFSKFKHPRSSAPVILDFGNAISPVNIDVADEVVLTNEGSPEEAKPAAKTRRTRPPSQTYDHIMAERKRREQLSQRFVALSAIVPGLKKMDKTSVLGETIKYLEHLQEKVKTLEQKATKQTMESVVLVKKSQINIEDEGSSDEKTTTTTSSSDGQPLPEIEARVCDKSVLVKIHCEKRRGVLVKILEELEKMNLRVGNTSVAPFGNLSLDITIIAEMGKESSVAAKDIVKTLRLALLENV